MEAAHRFVTMRLSKNGCGSDIGKSTITLHESLPRQIAVGLESVAIHNHSTGTHLQRIKGAMHSKDRCVKDIDFVNLMIIDDADCPSHSLRLNDGAQRVALSFGELFAIVKQWVVKIVGKDNCGGIDRTSKTTTSSLVASSLCTAANIASGQHIQMMCENAPEALKKGKNDGCNYNQNADYAAGDAQGIKTVVGKPMLEEIRHRPPEEQSHYDGSDTHSRYMPRCERTSSAKSIQVTSERSG